MKVELHILQNFAPSNLNRDDTGSPKSCEFGGYRRARVSSQSLKRAARTYAQKHGALRIEEDDDPTLSPFSKGSMLFKTELVERLVEKSKKDGQEARHVADFIFAETNLIKKEEDESGYRLVLGEAQFEQIRLLCEKNWEAFADLVGNSTAAATLKAAIKKAKSEKGKIERALKKKEAPELRVNLKAKEEEISNKEDELKKVEEAVKAAEGKLKDVVKEAETILDTKRAADIAMFGRMITSEPKYSIDAASQVAHAISTNGVNDVEFDYFTALDELKDPKLPGAAHINTNEFNSACYYRYANVDVEQLKKNLKDGDSELASNTLEAFLQAFVLAVPSGKQNSFATPTCPSLVLAVVREHSLCSLANAFERPINHREREEAGIIGSSIRRLAEHFDKLEGLYGDYIGKQAAVVFTDASDYLKYVVKKGDKEETATIKVNEVASLKALIEQVVQNAFPSDGQKGADGQ